MTTKKKPPRLGGAAAHRVRLLVHALNELEHAGMIESWAVGEGDEWMISIKPTAAWAGRFQIEVAS